MTGYTVHTGTSKKFVSGWDRVFGDEKAAKGTAKTTKNSDSPKAKKSDSPKAKKSTKKK